MQDVNSIEAPSHKLPPVMRFMVIGIIIGLVFIIGGVALDHYYPLWVWLILRYIGSGILVATVVGIGIDRLFYHEHLDALAKSLSIRFNQFDDRIKELIPEVLSGMAAGKTLKYLRNSQEIYTLIRSKLEEYPYFTNTIINQATGTRSQSRNEYYQRKVELVNRGELSCRELVAEGAIEIVKEQLEQIDKGKRENFKVKIVELSKNLNVFMNFCVFQRDFEDFDNAFLMIGWFSDMRAIYHRHTCVTTNHPDLIRLFVSYFEIVERSAEPYVIE